MRLATTRRLLLSLTGAGAALLLFGFVLLPPVGSLAREDPDVTSFMRYRMAEWEAEGRDPVLRWEWTPLERISPHLRRAVVVAEDDRFYEHRGMDWVALAEEVGYEGALPLSWTDPSDVRALASGVWFALSHRGELRGRSTITQQLAKNLYLTPERTLRRKGLEFVLARHLERHLEKDRILEIYLNVAEWGPGIFGAEAAARAYFGVSAAALDLEQAAALAATLPHPLTSNPASNPARMEWRKRWLLERLQGPGTG